ncbi:hypothetical protein OG840_61485 [Streptomyces sp. NBC_01764]|uniref:hypothetical protein n=1 Tax=Streptomyces sp. NBC_01764 TaxID=2975935 RepID=UPI00224D08BB|nr:hypothetical protein [Streptomyces sp. NBC_01764]MCX4411566.1 hypothetical protein [Streptomyces sp. NBC_01764]
MSRSVDQTGTAAPAPHTPTGPEVVLVIVIVLASVWLAPREMETSTILQLLGGAGVVGALAVGGLRCAGRGPLAAPVA